MFRFYWRQLVQSLFPRPRKRTRRLARTRPPFSRPHLEHLEDRTVPATVTYTAATDLLNFTADAGEADDVTVTAPAVNQVRIQVGNGDAIVLAGDAAANADFVLSTTVNADDTLTIDTAGSPAADFMVFLGDMGDTLTFGLASTPNGVTNVAIDGEADADTVNLNALTVGGSLTVAAETVNLAGDIQTDGAIDLQNAGAVAVQTSLTLDSEQGDDGAAGMVHLGAGSLSASAAGLTLTINAATAAAGANGGDVSFGPVNDAAGSFLQSLQVDTRSTNAVPGTAGTINLDNDVLVDGGTVRLQGRVDLGTAAAGTLTIDTERDNAGNGGAIDLGNATVAATNANVSLALDAGSGDAAGNGGTITLGSFEPFAALNRVLNLSASANGAARGNVSVPVSVQVDGDLTIENAATVTLAGNANLTAGGGVTVSSNVAAIDLTGAAGTSNIITAGDSVSLAAVADSGSPDELEINANNNVALTTVTIDNLLDIDVDEDGGGGTLTAGALSAGTITANGTGADDTFTFNGTVTSAIGGIAISQANQINLTQDVTAATTLTVSNVNTEIDLAQGVDLQASNGNVSLSSGVTAIDLSGAGGINVIAAGGTNNTVSLPVVAASGTPAELRLITDDINLVNTINVGGGIVSILPITAGRAINLGSNIDLGLTDLELDQITAGTLRIGSTAAGAITVSAGISATTYATLHLITGANVAQSGAGALTVTSLAVNAVTGVALGTNANNVATLAGAVSGAGAAFAFTDADTLTVGTVDTTVSGITTSGGTVTVSTVNGSLTVNDNVSADTAAVNLTAGGAGSTLDSNAAVSGNAVILRADRMALEGGTLSASTGRVILRTVTAGRAIDLGSVTDAAAALELSDAELDTITAGVLQIGDSAAGTITVSSPIDLTNNTPPVPTLHLITGAAVEDGTATEQADLSVSMLAIEAATGIGDGPGAADLDTAVTTLAFNNSTSGDVNVSNSGALTVAAVDGVNTSSAAAGGSLLAASPLTISANVTVGASFTFTAANSNNPDDDLTINNNATVTLNSAAGATLTFEAGDDIILGDGTGMGTIVTTGGGTHTVLLSADLEMAAVADGDRGGITQTTGFTSVTTNLLRATAGEGIGTTTTALMTAVSTLAARNDGTGGIFVANNVGGLLTIDDVAGLAGVTNAGTGAGAIVISNASPLTVNEPVINSAGGDIMLVAQDDGGDDDHLTINAQVIASGGDGDIVLSAGTDLIINDSGLTPDVSAAGAGMITGTANRDVLLNANVTIQAGTGAVSFTADNGVLTMQDTAVINAGSGTVTLSADGDVTLGRVVTTNATALAVSITSTSGSVVDGGDTGGADIEANAAGAVTTISAATGVGSADAIDTTIDTLDLTNSTSGNVNINEADALNVNRISQGGSGTVNVDAGGTITVVAGQAGVSATTGQVELDADGAGSDVAVNATVLTAGGAVNVLADADVTFGPAGSINSGGGNVTARADEAVGDNGGVLTMQDGSAIDAGAGTVTLSADGDVTLGRVVTTNATALAVSITSTSGSVVDGGDTGGADIEANAAGAVTTISAGMAIGAAGLTGQIDTTIADLTATANNGGVFIGESDGLTLTSVTATGAGNDVVVTSAAGNINVGSVTAPNTVRLTAAGAIEESGADAGADVTAAVIDLNADDGIGAADALEITGTTVSADTTNGNVNLNSLAIAPVMVTTLTTGTGNIQFTQTGNQTLEVVASSTMDGPIVITNAGADLTAGTVTAGGTDQDVTLTTTGAGNVRVDNVSAPDQAVVTAAGAIEESGADAEADVTAGVIDLNATTGIGAAAALEITGTTVTADTTNGDINLNSLAADNVLVQTLQTGTGNIRFDQTGGQTLTVQTATTGDGTITVSNAGGDLTAMTVTAGGAGDITLTTTAAGTISLTGDTTADGDDVTLFSVGGVSQTGGALTSDRLLLLGAGESFTLDRPNNDTNTLAARVAGVVTFRDADDLTIGNVNGTPGVSSDGRNITLTTGGLLTIGTGAGEDIVAGGAVTVDLNTAGATENAGSVISAGNLRLQGTGSFNLNQDNAIGTFAASVSGPVALRDTANLAVGVVNGTGGITTSGNPLTLNVGGSLTIQNVVTTGNTVNLTTGRDLTVNAEIDASGSTIVGNSGSAGAATVVIAKRLRAAQSTFVTNNAGDTFRIRPSEDSPIRIVGDDPVVVPGDRLEPVLFDAPISNFVRTPTGAGDSFNGSFTFAGRRDLTFENIEFIADISFTIVSFQTDPSNFSLLIRESVGTQTLDGAADVARVFALPFFLSPSFSSPNVPFSAPQVAAGDVNGDMVSDLIIGLGAGSGDAAGPLVTVLNGVAVNRARNGMGAIDRDDILAQFFAYDPTFRGGIYVAAGDIDGDGRDEIVTGANASAGPHVRTFRNAALPGERRVVIEQLAGRLGSFFAYDPGFLGGVRVAVGEVTGDGHADIITGTGPGAGPHVKVFDGASGEEVQSFFAFDPGFQGGIFIAVGNLDQTGRAEILVGAGVGAGPHVMIIDALQLDQKLPSGQITGSAVRSSFFAYAPQPVFLTPFPNSPPVLTGVSSLALGGLNGDRTRLTILVGTGRGLQTRVLTLDLATVLMDPLPDPDNPSFLLDGVQIGGAIIL